MWRRVVCYKSTNDSEESINSIFRVFSIVTSVRTPKFQRLIGYWIRGIHFNLKTKNTQNYNFIYRSAWLWNLGF
jgi:hypothetical protein